MKTLDVLLLDENELTFTTYIVGERHAKIYDITTAKNYGLTAIENFTNEALENWVNDYPIVEHILTKVGQTLLNGSPVFATGGGMAISVIADWVERYCCADIVNAQYFVLKNPQDVNLTGLSHLTK